MTRLKRPKQLPSGNREDVRFGTRTEVATWRAQRLAKLAPGIIVEIGAGAGFQTAAFAKVAKRVIAVDIAEERLARADVPENVVKITGDALDSAVIEKIKTLIEKDERLFVHNDFEVVSGRKDVLRHDDGRSGGRCRVLIFLDPERPPASAERTIDEIKPDLKEFVKLYSAISPDIAIELPPFLADIPFDCEREYASVDGKLNRLTIYLGALKNTDVSVVALPAGARIATSGIPKPLRDAPCQHPKYVLEPDAALVRAGLVAEALGNALVEEIDLGNRVVYFTKEPVQSPFFRKYAIVASGKEKILETLSRYGAVILHGKLDQERQRVLLRELQPRCKGDGRAHLFLADEWVLAR